MKATNQPDFIERRSTAAAAKKRLFEKMQQAPKPDDPEVIASRAGKADLAAQNSARRAERVRLKREAVVQQKRDDEARALSEAIAAKAKLEAASERSVEKQAEQKAERDRRYAARKNRNR